MRTRNMVRGMMETCRRDDQAGRATEYRKKRFATIHRLQKGGGKTSGRSSRNSLTRYLPEDGYYFSKVIFRAWTKAPAFMEYK